MGRTRKINYREIFPRIDDKNVAADGNWGEWIAQKPIKTTSRKPVNVFQPNFEIYSAHKHMFSEGLPTM
jgi:hypothetical protein